MSTSSGTDVPRKVSRLNVVQDADIGSLDVRGALDVTGTTTMGTATLSGTGPQLTLADGAGTFTVSTDATGDTTLSSSGQDLNLVGPTHLNLGDAEIRFRNDLNHAIRYLGTGFAFAGETAPDGPVMYGFGGGSVGSTNGGEAKAAEWNTSRFVIRATEGLELPGRLVYDAEFLPTDSVANADTNRYHTAYAGNTGGPALNIGLSDVAASAVGTIKKISHVNATVGGNYILTPDNLQGFTSITMTGGASCTLRWLGTEWQCIDVTGGAVLA